MKQDEKETKRSSIITILALIVIIVSLAGALCIKIINDKNTKEIYEKNIENVEKVNIETNEVQDNMQVEEKKEIKIFNGNDRPIAVMIDNHSGAWPQASLNKTYMVYEIIVEGGETRLMALFKGQDLENVGPVRSSRHYFLDYAMENDAIYVHYGWSPQAKRDISKYSVNNINGIYYSNSQFRRIKGKSAPHNVMVSTDKILSIAKKLKYKTTSTETSVLNYVSDEVELQDGITAETITIPHSNLQNVKYTYDSKTGRYTRYARGKLQKDYTTGEAVTTKNIIIEYIDNSSLSDGSGKGRQTISNIGTFKGYYITNGKAIQITCEKKFRTAKTVYKDLNGNILEVNDGNTCVNICPKKAKVVIK